MKVIYHRSAVLDLRRILDHYDSEAGRANQKIPDDQVLAFATEQRPAVLTLNRLNFLRLRTPRAFTQESSSAPVMMPIPPRSPRGFTLQLPTPEIRSDN